MITGGFKYGAGMRIAIKSHDQRLFYPAITSAVLVSMGAISTSSEQMLPTVALMNQVPPNAVVCGMMWLSSYYRCSNKAHCASIHRVLKISRRRQQSVLYKLLLV